MAQEMCVLPMRCKRCNTVFDLYYDLQEQERELKEEGFSTDLGMKRLLSQSFCWRCRNTVQEEIEQVHDFAASEDAQEFELILDLEE